MKYGLPREKNQKNKWKTTIENELRCLQMEVCFLKKQLDESTKKLAEFTSPKLPDPFPFIQGPSKDEKPLSQCSNNVTNNFPSTNKSLPGFTTDCNGNNNQRFFTSCSQSSQGNLFASAGNEQGTTPYLYHSTMITTFGEEYGSQIVSVTAMPEYESKSLEELRFEDYKITTHNSPKRFFYGGTERPRYQSTWDYDTMTRKAVRFHSITCMPSYKDDKSFEELRYEDYVLKGIGFSNQIQKYKDSNMRFSRTERNLFSFTPKNLKPLERKHFEGFTNHSTPFMIPWYLTPEPPKAPYLALKDLLGPSSNKSNETSNSPASDNIEFAASNVSIVSNFDAEQNKSEPIFTFQTNSESKNYSDHVITTKDENLSSQVLLELRKIGEQMSSINDRMSKMDSNLSDVSSRVSVMDSRLSAVDMFVTMQRFNKKWQTLETRLDGLETPSPAKATTLPVDQRTSKNTSPCKVTTMGESVMQKEQTNSIPPGNEKNESSPISKIGITTPKTSITNTVESLPATDISDMNLSDFVRSVSCTDITMGSKSLYTSTLSDHSAVTDSSSKVKLEIASIEMADLKSNSLPLESPLIENLSSQEDESIISNSGKVPTVSAHSKEKGNNNEETQANSFVVRNEITGTLDKTKVVEKTEPQENSFDKDNNNGKKSNDPLGVTEQQDSSSTKPVDLWMKEMDENDENEFVIVEKSDVEESLDENSKTKPMYSAIKYHVDEASSESEFKMYSDITEYLEINLGKKKNLVYEFGFEAKPDYLLESEGSPGYENKSVETQENKVENPSRDDSFQQFKTNFIENKSVDAKQSSPFPISFKPKTPEESPVIKSVKTRKAVRSRRLRMLCKV